MSNNYFEDFTKTLIASFFEEHIYKWNLNYLEQTKLVGNSIDEDIKFILVGLKYKIGEKLLSQIVEKEDILKFSNHLKKIISFIQYQNKKDLNELFNTIDSTYTIKEKEYKELSNKEVLNQEEKEKIEELNNILQKKEEIFQSFENWNAHSQAKYKTDINESKKILKKYYCKLVHHTENILNKNILQLVVENKQIEDHIIKSAKSSFLHITFLEASKKFFPFKTPFSFKENTASLKFLNDFFLLGLIKLILDPHLNKEWKLMFIRDYMGPLSSRISFGYEIQLEEVNSVDLLKELNQYGSFPLFPLHHQINKIKNLEETTESLSAEDKKQFKEFESKILIGLKSIEEDRFYKSKIDKDYPFIFIFLNKYLKIKFEESLYDLVKSYENILKKIEERTELSKGEYLLRINKEKIIHDPIEAKKNRIRSPSKK